MVLICTLGAFTYIFLTKKDFDAKLLRNLGNTFSVGAGGLIDNSLKLSLTNRTDDPRKYTIGVIAPRKAIVRPIESPKVGTGWRRTQLCADSGFGTFEDFADGRCPVQLRISTKRVSSGPSIHAAGTYQAPTFRNLSNGQMAMSTAYNTTTPDISTLDADTRRAARAERHACFLWTSFILLLLGGSISMWIYAGSGRLGSIDGRRARLPRKGSAVGSASGY